MASHSLQFLLLSEEASLLLAKNYAQVRGESNKRTKQTV